MRCSVVGLLDPCRPCHWPILRICVPKRRRPRGRAFGNSGLAMPGRNPRSIRSATKDAARASPPSLLRHLRPPPSSPWLQWDARRVSMVPSLIPAPPDGDQPQGTRTLSHIPPQSARGRRRKTCFKGFFGVCPRQVRQILFGVCPRHFSGSVPARLGSVPARFRHRSATGPSRPDGVSLESFVK